MYSSKRNMNENNDMLFIQSKQWKESPPGPEQREIEKLFNNKSIKETDTPSTVQVLSPLFSNFSSTVFAAHFRKTKSKLGLFVKPMNDIEKCTNKIPQLGQSETLTRNLICVDDVVDEDINIRIINPPYVAWVCDDHKTKSQFVYLAVPIISGTTAHNFNLSEDGLKVSINFVWPSAICTPEELFDDELNDENEKNRVLASDHKIFTLTNHLLENNVTGNSKPKSHMIVTLPIPVQREIGSFKKKAMTKKDGTKIILLQFKGYQKRKLFEDVDKSLNFD